MVFLPSTFIHDPYTLPNLPVSIYIAILAHFPHHSSVMSSPSLSTYVNLLASPLHSAFSRHSLASQILLIASFSSPLPRAGLPWPMFEVQKVEMGFGERPVAGFKTCTRSRAIISWIPPPLNIAIFSNIVIGDHT